MIRKKTVFILGAGSSVPYGYPTAPELRRDIISKFKSKFKNYFAEFYSDKVDFNMRFEPFKEMIYYFDKSSIQSIDLFLSRNKKFDRLGKFITVLMLLNNERESKFRENMDDPKLDWYTAIYNELTNEIINDNQLELFKENDVCFITFNYDRSLEHFLYESFSNSFTSKVDDIANLLNEHLKIIHIYGKLADLEWQSDKGIPYGSDIAFRGIQDCMNNINLMFDTRKEISNLLFEANEIYFLGFGYYIGNLTSLSIPNVLADGRNILNIYGTALGQTEVQRYRTIDKIRKDSIPVNMFKIIDSDSLGLIKEYLLEDL